VTPMRPLFAAVLPSAEAGPCAAADEAVCRWALEGRPAPAIDHARLGGIYAREGFEEAQSRRAGGLEHLWERLAGLLESLFGSAGAQGFAEWTRTLVLVAAALFALMLLVRVGRRLLQRSAIARRPLPGRSSAPFTSPPPGNSSGAHLARARQLIRGDAREGIREGLLGLLAALEGAGYSRPERVRTNRELARELPARGAPGALVGEVRALLDWYDRAFYSLARVGEEEAERFLVSVETLVAQLPGAAP